MLSSIKSKALKVSPSVLSRSIATTTTTTTATSSEPKASTDTPSQDDQALVKAAQQTQETVISTETTQHKSVAEQDAELMRKLGGISGEGGEAGIEYENGKAVAMKRGVKNNMFRLI